jgi:radical SAM superfamily enzyme YgiQ (UPF0313 family)
MKPLVVLIQPLTNIFDSGKKSPTLPLALLSAARRLADDCRIRLVDLRRNRTWRAALAEALREPPVCIGVTSITGNQLFSALEATRRARELSAAPIVWGGVHATLFPEQALAEPAIDFVVRREGEATFAELVRCLADGGDPAAVRGLSWRRDGAVVHNPERPIVELDEEPEIPYHVFPGKPVFLTEGQPTLYFETARGCPSRCAYCYNAVVHHSHWRAQSAETVLARVDWIRANLPEVQRLSIVDDNYVHDLDRVRRIADGLIGRGAPFAYQIQGAHVRTTCGLSDADLRLLRRSGCVRVDMGVESGSPPIVRALCKPVDLDDVRALNRRLIQADIRPWYNFMVGFPDETDADVDATRTLMMQLTAENRRALVSPWYQFVPYPGTALFDVAVQRGYRPPATLAGWRDHHAGAARAPWLDERRRRENRILYFLSIFVDAKIEQYDANLIIRLLARCYRPIARFRMKRRCFGLLLEAAVFRRLFDIS